MYTEMVWCELWMQCYVWWKHVRSFGHSLVWLRLRYVRRSKRTTYLRTFSPTQYLYIEDRRVGLFLNERTIRFDILPLSEMSAYTKHNFVWFKKYIYVWFMQWKNFELLDRNYLITKINVDWLLFSADNEIFIEIKRNNIHSSSAFWFKWNNSSYSNSCSDCERKTFIFWIICCLFRQSVHHCSFLLCLNVCVIYLT